MLGRCSIILNLSGPCLAEQAHLEHAEPPKWIFVDIQLASVYCLCSKILPSSAAFDWVRNAMKKFLSDTPSEEPMTGSTYSIELSSLSCSDRVKYILLDGFDRHNRDSLKEIPIFHCKVLFSAQPR